MNASMLNGDPTQRLLNSCTYGWHTTGLGTVQMPPQHMGECPPPESLLFLLDILYMDGIRRVWERCRCPRSTWVSAPRVHAALCGCDC